MLYVGVCVNWSFFHDFGKMAMDMRRTGGENVTLKLGKMVGECHELTRYVGAIWSNFPCTLVSNPWIQTTKVELHQQVYHEALTKIKFKIGSR